MAAKSPADRVKATRLRHKLREEGELGADDMAWLETYGDEVNGAVIDASASKEKVIHIEERSAAAQGAHPHPDAYAAIATAEGLRADTLLRICTQAMIQSNDQYRLMTLHLMERTTRIEDAHVAMLEAVREHYLARVEAEAENRVLAAGGENASELHELVELLKLAAEAKRGSKAVEKSKAKRRRKPLGAL